MSLERYGCLSRYGFYFYSFLSIPHSLRVSLSHSLSITLPYVAYYETIISSTAESLKCRASSLQNICLLPALLSLPEADQRALVKNPLAWKSPQSFTMGPC